MTTIPSTPASKIGAGKLWVFRGLTLSLGILAGAFVAESGLRWQQARIKRSDALDPGLIQYDATLGWALSPGWTGRHVHYDYTASYRIDARGLRNDSAAGVPSEENRLTLVVGDSFTFGLGVNDDATFVHHLQASRPDGRVFVNGAVPGFSTDQEALLIEQKISALKPAQILLVVYLGNDLFDNPRPFPLQASSPKPYFVMTAGGLALRNSPVPQEPKPRGAGDLVTTVWGDERALWPWRTRLEQKSELFRVAAQTLLPEKNHQVAMAARFAPNLQLFDLILQRIMDECARNHVRLTVVPLAGQSFIDQPGSVSAQYQELFRAHVLASCRQQRLPAIDLAGLMRTRHRQQGEEWFFPNEGHLNAAGHRLVAEILHDELARVK